MKLSSISHWIFTHIVFLNPALWPYRETFSKVLAGLIILFLFVTKAKTVQAHIEAGTVNDLWIIWSWEVLMLLIYFIAYLQRKPAKKIAYGFWEVVFPIFVALLPILIVMSSLNLAPIPYPTIFGAILMFSGAIINLIGLYQLRSAFSIMAEARTLIDTGLYRWVRHPIYTGHFILFLGALIWHWHPITIAAYVLFVVTQTYRAKIEERKLSEAFSSYEKYKKNTGMFFPGI